MRDDVLMRLSDRVINDGSFRARLRDDLDGTLRAEGYELTDDELAAVRQFHASVAQLSDTDLHAAVAATVNRRQFAS